MTGSSSGGLPTTVQTLSHKGSMREARVRMKCSCFFCMCTSDSVIKALRTCCHDNLRLFLAPVGCITGLDRQVLAGSEAMKSEEFVFRMYIKL